MIWKIALSFIEVPKSKLEHVVVSIYIGLDCAICGLDSHASKDITGCPQFLRRYRETHGRDWVASASPKIYLRFK
jgi:hypothetical protein